MSVGSPTSRLGILILMITIALTCTQLSLELGLSQPIEEPSGDNSIDVACGTIATNMSVILVKNPQYPQPTYEKSVCETVVEKANPAIAKLVIKFRKLELYRPTTDGECIHDRFAIYTDLNAAVSSIICGNHSGETISVPFLASQTSLIVSITTSDLDHERVWEIEIGQEV